MDPPQAHRPSVSSANAAPTADKILKECMHKITQIVVRARIPSLAEVSGMDMGSEIALLASL